MNTLRHLILLPVALGLFACRHTDPDSYVVPPTASDSLSGLETGAPPEERFEHAERLYQQGKLMTAQTVLAPLLGSDYRPERVGALNTAINRKLATERQAQVEDLADRQDSLEKQERQRLKRAGDRLNRAHNLVEDEKLDEAEKTLAPLLGSGLFEEEVDRLVHTIMAERTRSVLERAQAASEVDAMLQVEEGLVLPGNYGETVVISPELPMRKVPPGPMEKVVGQQVSMRLKNAGVEELIMALSDLAEPKLNIIVDQALEAQKKVTVNVEKVPLHELLRYISRNMGIAFHVGRNAIWVTESMQPGGGGPQMETRIFKLRAGFVPHMQGGGGLGLGQESGGYQKPSVQETEDTELEDVLQTFLEDSPEGANYRLFKKRNILVVHNTAEKLRLVEEFLDAFDTAPLQVLIEARFVTLRQSDLFQLGFNVQNLIFPKSGTTATFGDLRESAEEDVTLNKDQSVDEAPDLALALSQKRLEAAGNFPGGTMTLSGILGTTTFQAVLDALKEVGSSRTLSAPRITVANNQIGHIFRGTKRYYFEEYDIEQVDFGDLGTRPMRVPTGSPKELALGLYLSVLPNIGNDQDTMILKLHPQITDFVDYETFGNEGFVKMNIVNEESIDTTVVG